MATKHEVVLLGRKQTSSKRYLENKLVQIADMRSHYFDFCGQWHTIMLALRFTTSNKRIEKAELTSMSQAT